MSAESDEPYIFDDGPLSHFAEAGWLGMLQLVVGERHAWLPETVRREVGLAVDTYPHLRAVLEATWLTHRSILTDIEQTAFGHYTSRLLGPNGENLGECGVLALAEANNAVAVIDDGFARTVAAERGVAVKTTVALLCDLVNGGHISLDVASTVADNLLATEYRLPFLPGGFKAFVLMEDLIMPPYDEY
ncbi:nucleotide-binding protein [Microbacterium ureisolvens]|uniref:Nucleotide-binding protein n=1 Tax=Microbacterium ureisolvens TaxID=2781186 RepID=A0ABS7HZW8_9MICO|nr:nucleotide-binding protein [Microbacterium ureisolvens]MBW9110150.1 nucleotide-binding protein [Microbacterium ureisolvens]